MEERWLAFALELADQARRFLRRRFRSGTEVILKSDGTPVSAADRELEARMRERIRAAFPEHGILGEEEGAERSASELLWVLDPIDGTKAFAAGKPLFGSLIALVQEGRPLLGVIEAPATRERWVGCRGRPTLYDGRPVRVRPARALSTAVVCLGAPGTFPGEHRAGLARLDRAVAWSLVQLDCYGYGMLARGDVDAVIEHGLAPHDVCALVPVVEGAGGAIRRWDGDAAGLQASSDVVASSWPRLGEELVRLLIGDTDPGQARSSAGEQLVYPGGRENVSRNP